jgi:hypothetical protein
MALGVFRIFLLSALTVCAASSECLSDPEGAACNSFDLLREAAVVVGAVDELEPFKIPPNCDCTCTPTAAPTPAPTEEVDIKDDPHIRNLAQESFAVNQPGEYTLLRVPQDPGQDALLEVRGTIGRHNSSACKMYTMGVSLSGKWLGDKAVFVRPLQRGSAGSNAAAGEEKWPLSLLVSEKGSHEWPRDGAWTSFEAFRAASKPDRSHGFPETFKIVAFRDEAFGEMREGETFQFQVGPGPKWEQKAKINVAQASHQALNLALQQVKRLGAMHIGGLLGTEAHEPRIERLTQECRQEKAAQITIPDQVSLFSTSASMTETRPSVIYSWWH